MREKTESLSERAKEAVSSFLDEMGDVSSSPRHKELRYGFLIGGIIGSLLGAGAASLIANKMTRHEEGFMDRFHAPNVRSVLRGILDMIEDRAEPYVKSADRSKTVHDILDFAMTGLELWKGFRNSRRH
jgi:hypothetical protein